MVKASMLLEDHKNHVITITVGEQDFLECVFLWREDYRAMFP